MSREENSVLFSLNHLRAMAATASPSGFSPAPIRREPSMESLYVASPIAPSVLLASVGPRERPRWLIPAIAGVGSLLALFLALVLVLVLQKPEPQLSAAPSSVTGAVPAPTLPAASPQGEPSKVASAAPAPIEEDTSVDQGTAKTKEPKKLAKGKRGKRGKARIGKRGKRGKRAHATLIAAAPKKAKKARSHRRDALDDLLDQALK
jgi:hypothetical protein